MLRRDRDYQCYVAKSLLKLVGEREKSTVKSIRQLDYSKPYYYAARPKANMGKIEQPPFDFGNPYVLKDEADRERILQEHAEHYLFDNFALKVRNTYRLTGKELICYCSPKGCHTEILALLANEAPGRIRVNVCGYLNNEVIGTHVILRELNEGLTKIRNVLGADTVILYLPDNSLGERIAEHFYSELSDETIPILIPGEPGGYSDAADRFHAVDRIESLQKIADATLVFGQDDFFSDAATKPHEIYLGTKLTLVKLI